MAVDLSTATRAELDAEIARRDLADCAGRDHPLMSTWRIDPLRDDVGTGTCECGARRYELGPLPTGEVFAVEGWADGATIRRVHTGRTP